eukprot:3239766-Alexandrium_andersonii.AAC.1
MFWSKPPLGSRHPSSPNGHNSPQCGLESANIANPPFRGGCRRHRASRGACGARICSTGGAP